MTKFRALLSTAVASAALAGCGGGGGRAADSPRLLFTAAVPNISSSKTFSYDGGLVDGGAYYLTDRNNKSVDVFSTGSIGANTLPVVALITGSGANAFAGAGATPDTSGPNSVNRVAGTNKIYATDVNSVKVIDTVSGTIIKSIPIVDATGKPTGNRADGSCFDKDDGIMMANNSADNFSTWIDTRTDTVIARFDYPDATSGLEVCVYDPATKKFFVNNDGTATNPDGELDSFSAASVKAGTPTLVDRFGLPACNPNGLDLGPGNDAVIGCDPSGTAGRKLISLIVDRTTGQAVTVPFGGSDLVAYDSGSNRYYLAARNWQNAGVADPTLPKNPVLGIIDAASKTVIARLPAGSGAHSVSVDAKNGVVYVPFTATKNSADFANGGVAVYSIH